MTTLLTHTVAHSTKPNQYSSRAKNGFELPLQTLGRKHCVSSLENYEKFAIGSSAAVSTHPVKISI